MSNQAKAQKEGPLLFFYRIIQGALIGGGAILPGVSGGVLAVVFGIYRPMMAFLSRPIQTFKSHWKLFVPIILGVALGFWGFAGLVDILFSAGTGKAPVAEPAAIVAPVEGEAASKEALAAAKVAVEEARPSPLPLALFVGLIFGTVPMLYRDAQKPKNGSALTDKEKRNNRLALIISFVLLMGFLYLVSSGEGQDIKPTLLWSFLSGIIWGFSLVVPGLSSSAILLFIGIYTKLMAGVKDLDFGIILPLLLGIVIVAFVFARFVDKLFDRHYGVASNAVVGLVVASTLAIVLLPPKGYAITSLGQGAAALGVAAVGFVAAHFLAKWGEKIKPD